MDLTRLNGVVDKSFEKINNITDKTNGFITSINEVIDIVENTVNNGINNSAVFVFKKLEHYYNKIDKIVDSFRKWLNDAIKALNTWYDELIIKRKKSIIRETQSKLGLTLSDDEITILAKSIPHPPLQIPNFAFDIPEFNFDVENYTLVSIHIPRIPLFPTPWKEKQENIKENISNIVYTTNAL